MGKDIHSLLEEVKGVDWKGKMNDVMESLKPYALRVGRTAARPLLQFWFVMGDGRTSALDKVVSIRGSTCVDKVWLQLASV